MIIKFVLIIISMSYHGEIHISQQEYLSKNACEAAQDYVVHAFDDKLPQHLNDVGYYHDAIRTKCVGM